MAKKRIVLQRTASCYFSSWPFHVMKNTVAGQMEPHHQEAYDALFASEEAFWRFMHLTALAFEADEDVLRRFNNMLTGKGRRSRP